MRDLRGGGGVEIRGHGRVDRASGVRCPSRVVGEFSADYIFNSSGEVVDSVKAFEKPSAGHLTSREQRVRGPS
jgi:hypothetical protein